jgi:hypothetical protein
MIVETMKYGPGEPCVRVWLGSDESAYRVWEDRMGDDVESEAAKPDPTLTIFEPEMNDIVIAWLQGPPGPQGAMGAMGPPGR